MTRVSLGVLLGVVIGVVDVLLMLPLAMAKKFLPRNWFRGAPLFSGTDMAFGATRGPKDR